MNRKAISGFGCLFILVCGVVAIVGEINSCQNESLKKEYEAKQVQAAKDNREKKLYNECTAPFIAVGLIRDSDKALCARMAARQLATEELEESIKKSDQEHINKLEH